ncbi:SusC/RagA family TonB-linked outer membrane protein [Arcticibacter sp. MXS-1]|uniref:SusC/RagA family TonB-linked outer membrane protein n=1 Tax=Arcticibacter sp. MXS-1 TaxID=3341726 RepID=UPI0035A88C09
MKRFLSFLFYAVLLVSVATAQERTITGTVTGRDDKLPLPGVSIRVKGTQIGTQTSGNGQYSIKVPGSNSVLVFSYVGYAAQEIQVGARANVDVALGTDAKQLGEVVVVGYGTQSRKSITGAVTRIGGDAVANIPVPSLESAIQGRAAGVFVEAQNGKLGQGIKIRVRGSSSISAGNEPLYVVDGLPITTDNLSNSGGSTSPLADLNQNDIESIQVLKDASASAIYGSRASNGVVIITTKKGKAGRTNVNFNTYYGWSKPTNKRKFLNAEQYVTLLRQAAVNGAPALVESGDFETEQDVIDFVESRLRRYSAGNDDYKTFKVNTNWQDQVIQDAPVQNYNLTFNGGSEKTKFYISATYNDQKGFIISNRINQYNIRTNLENKVNDWLNIGANLNFVRTLNKRLPGDNAFANPYQITALSPITPAIDPRTGLTSGALDLATGEPNGTYPAYFNPVLSAENAYYNTLVYRNLGNVFADVKLLPELNFRTEVGGDVLNQNEDSYYGRLNVRNIGTPNGFGASYNTSVLNINTNNFFQFNKTFASDHKIDAVLGTSYQMQRINTSSAQGQQFPSDAYKQLISSADIIGGSSTETQYSLLSYFTRINYSYNNKYLLSLSGRIDGSSRFGDDHKYGFFPAASAGWILTEEDFLKDNRVLSNLKVRASYGVTGNSEISNFASRGLYSAFSYAGTPGARPTQLANPDLKWESTSQLDLGLDFGFLNGRITGEFDVYDKRTKDLLLNIPVPGTSGFTTVYRNIGKLRNKGLEFNLNSYNLTGSFQWSTNLNFSMNRNKITGLGGQLINGSSGVNIAKEGEAIGVFYIPEYAGVDPQNGDALYYKNTVNSDGSIDRTKTNNYSEAQRIVAGNPNPKFIAGLGNNFSYKGFDLSVLLQATYGNKIYNGAGIYMSASGSNGFDNQTEDQAGAWQKPGDQTNVPQARLYSGNGAEISTRYMTSGSYLRVKNVTLGYNLPKSVLTKIKLQSLRVYATAINLATITKYKGWDPEVNSDDFASSTTSGNINQGYDFYSAPQAKTITFGVNVGF